MELVLSANGSCCSADEERQHPGVLLDQLERDRLHNRPGSRVLPGNQRGGAARSRLIWRFLTSFMLEVEERLDYLTFKDLK